MKRPSQRRVNGDWQGVRTRGRVLSKEDLHKIQRFINRRKDLTLQEISIEFCKLWNWRRPNGEWREVACAALLRRLARRGNLRFPPWLKKHLEIRKRQQPTRSLPTEALKLVWPSESQNNQHENEGRLLVRPTLEKEQAVWNQLMERWHYLGYRRLVGESLRYAAFLSGQVVALLSWGAAALKCGPRDRYIGWNENTKFENLHLVVNNTRFLVLPWCREKNLASRILSLNLKRLSADWEAAYNHPVHLAETFIDPSRFRGICYRASNWQILGETRGWSKQGAGYRHHGIKKLVLVYPLHRRAKELLRTPRVRQQEVKRNMTDSFDVTRLPLHGEGGLFEVLERVTDKRKPRGIRHPLISILALAACATLCGAKSLIAIAQWAANVSQEVRSRLGCRRNRPPSEPTFRRQLKDLGVAQLESLVGEWFSKQTGLDGKGVSLDGKTLRGSGDGDAPPAHLVSLHSHEDGVVLGEERVPDKTNEIKAAKPLMEPVDLQGAIITADAMHAQKETASYIVEEKKADYIFVVKENQPTLLEKIKQLPFRDFPPSGGDGEQGTRSPGDA